MTSGRSSCSSGLLTRAGGPDVCRSKTRRWRCSPRGLPMTMIRFTYDDGEGCRQRRVDPGYGFMAAAGSQALLDRVTYEEIARAPQRHPHRAHRHRAPHPHPRDRPRRGRRRPGQVRGLRLHRSRPREDRLPKRTTVRPSSRRLPLHGGTPTRGAPVRLTFPEQRSCATRVCIGPDKVRLARQKTRPQLARGRAFCLFRRLNARPA